MAMRINHNINSINTQKQLESTQRANAANLQRLSSGLKINAGVDGPANLVISENMRAQMSGLDQAITNSEHGISLVQTAEGALNEVSRLLVDVRQLAVHASNEGVNDEKMLAADQAEIENALATIDRISANTQFGSKRLFDGSKGANGVANGEGLQFVGADEKTVASSVDGYDIVITQAATKSNFSGKVALTQQIVDAEERMTFREGGKTVSFTATKGDNVQVTLDKLRDTVEKAGLDIKISMNAVGVLEVEHKKYGSEYSFTASSSTAGVLSSKANISEESTLGRDVKGTIGGEEATGRGQVLTGNEVNKKTAGLTIRYTGNAPTPVGQTAGTVSVVQNSLRFQVGANEGQNVSLSLKNMSTRALGTGVVNDSGLKSLQHIKVTDFQGAQDSIMLIDKAIEETSTTRASLGAFQKNTLQSGLNNLRQSSENITASESVIRDADMAEEMSQFTKNQILIQSSTAMLAQANQQTQTVLALMQ